MSSVDAVVVGSGPNGLAAALTLAKAGLAVEVIEGDSVPGGGCRTASLTAAGFRHDVCSAVHPLLLTSPFFRQPEFDQLRGCLRYPKVPFATPIDGDVAVSAFRSLDETVDALGPDGPAYDRLMGPLVRHAQDIADATLAPLRSIPRHPIAMGRFGVPGLLPAGQLVRLFKTEEAKALLGGVAAHSMAPLTAPLTSAFGMLLAMTAHHVGWPVVEGGSSTITDTMLAELQRRGGSITTGRWVRSLAELPPSAIHVLDVSPKGFLGMAGSVVPEGYAKRLRRFRYGPGVCKVDWALSGPVPWKAPSCLEAGTVHLGGTFAEMANSEAEVAAGRHPERPYCIVVQPGVADSTRAPAGKQSLWSYCHVPAGSTRDMTSSIREQIERFAPGFSDLVIESSAVTAAEEEQSNPNYVGGDIAAGASSLTQTIFRPTIQWNPYRTPLKGVYLCSASTPPGAGVHGMCGFYAARTALHDCFGGPPPLR